MAQTALSRNVIYVRAEVIGLQEHGRRRVEVTWKRQFINQLSEVIQEGVFDTLVARGTMAIKYPERNAA
jgi:hypothetical protein